MSYAEDILKLRARISDAMLSGALDPSKETLEAVLIQIMNDAERNRQNTIGQAENLRKQAATLDGQAAAFSSVVSIIYNVINGFIKIAERAKEKDEAEDVEAAQKAEAAAQELIDKSTDDSLEVFDLKEVKEPKKVSKPAKKKPANQ